MDSKKPKSDLLLFGFYDIRKWFIFCFLKRPNVFANNIRTHVRKEPEKWIKSLKFPKKYDKSY